MENISNKLDIFNDPLLTLCLVIPFVKVFAIGDTIRHYLYGITVFYAAIIAIFFLTNFSLFKLTKFACAFSIGIILSSVVSDEGSVLYGIIYGCRLFAFIGIIELYFINQSTLFLSTFKYYLTVLFFINYGFQLFNQEYFGHVLELKSSNYNNFLVDDNLLPFYFFALLTLIVYLRKDSKITLLDTITIIVGYMSLLKAWCVSGIIAASICLILITISYSPLCKFKLNGFFVWIGILFINLGAIFMNNLIVYFDNTLVQYFGKSIIRLRAPIWSTSIQNIKNSIFLGYGTNQGGRPGLNYVNGQYLHSHNFILEYLSQGGIVLLIIYMVMMFSILRELNKSDEIHICNVLCSIMIGIHIAFLTEGTIVDPLEYVPYILIYYCNERIDFFSGSKYKVVIGFSE